MDECRMIVESNLQMFFELEETKQLKVIERGVEMWIIRMRKAKGLWGRILGVDFNSVITNKCSALYICLCFSHFGLRLQRGCFRILGNASVRVNQASIRFIAKVSYT